MSSNSCNIYVDICMYNCIFIVYLQFYMYIYTYSNMRYSLYRIRLTYIDLQQAVDQIPMAGNAG